MKQSDENLNSLPGRIVLVRSDGVWSIRRAADDLPDPSAPAPGEGRDHSDSFGQGAAPRPRLD